MKDLPKFNLNREIQKALAKIQHSIDAMSYSASRDIRLLAVEIVSEIAEKTSKIGD